MTEDNPIQVTDPIVVEDMSEVKEKRSLTPIAQKVKVRINKASVQTSNAGDIKGLNCELRIVDGIEVLDHETGMSELKYVNKPLFTSMMDLCVWAAASKSDPSVNPKYQWWKDKQHLVGFKQFLTALGYDVKTPPTINDDFLQELIGREILIDIQHEEESAVDQNTGERKKLGTFRERVRNFRSIESEIQG